MTSEVLKKYSFNIEMGIEETDIVSIYEGGVDSSICADSSMAKEWKPLFDKTSGDFHTVNFYNAHPQIGVAWVKLGGHGKVLARTILWRPGPTGEFKQSGAYYYDGYLFAHSLHQFLNSRGIKQKTDKDAWTTLPFRMKGIEVENKIYAPLPFFDNLEPVRARYLADSNEFEFQSDWTQGSSLCDGRDHRGFITSDNPRMVTPMQMNHWGS